MRRLCWNALQHGWSEVFKRRYNEGSMFEVIKKVAKLVVFPDMVGVTGRNHARERLRGGVANNSV